MAKPKVVITRKIPAAAEERARSLFDVELNTNDTPLGAAGLARAMCEADGLLPCVADKITAELLATPERRVKIVANYGVGYNNIDVAAAKENGVVVTNTPDVLTEDTADLALTLMLATARRTGEGERELRGGKWTGWRPDAHARDSGARQDARPHRHRAHRARGGAPRASRIRHADHLPRSVSAERGGGGSAGRRARGEHRGGAARERLRLAALSGHAGNEAPDECRALRADAEGLDPDQHRARRRGERERSHRGAAGGHDRRCGARCVREGAARAGGARRSMENVVLLPHLGSATTETRVAMGMRAIDNLEAFFGGTAPRDRVA